MGERECPRGIRQGANRLDLAAQPGVFRRSACRGRDALDLACSGGEAGGE